MNTAIATGKGSSQGEGQFAGIGLAIPLAMIRPVVEQIIDTGTVEKGFLGIGGEKLSTKEIKGYEILGFFDGLGVKVTRVTEGTPAFAEGVRVGDIISQVNDDVIDSFEQLRSMISSMRPGEIARIKLWRYDYASKQGRTIIIPVRLAQLSSGSVASLISDEDLKALGFESISTFTRGIASDKNVDYTPGVIIEAIVPDSTLEKYADPGYLVTRIGDKSIQNLQEFHIALSQYDLRDGVRIRLMSPEGSSFHLRLKIP